ncbi:MAG TPA: hypothetical protein VMD78_17470 [Candidatus Baltobacteraceae bacterium]|nr:hypothetical protein [Candidatus Baltobacteraceae bacterium]
MAIAIGMNTATAIGIHIAVTSPATPMLAPCAKNPKNQWFMAAHKANTSANAAAVKATASARK